MKNVLITGATGGIGKSLVSKFNKNGFNVCATGTNTEKLSELDRKYGKNIKCIRCDLSNETEIKELITQAKEYFGNINILINNAGIAKDGVYYLFFVRMTPIFPFFLINILFSVTKIKALQFYIVSQVGMLLGTLLFINAGTQISKINSIEDILNKYVIISLVLIALMPIVIKKTFVYCKSKI